MPQYWEGKEITRINPYKIKFSFVRHYVEFLINECVELMRFFFLMGELVREQDWNKSDVATNINFPLEVRYKKRRIL